MWIPTKGLRDREIIYPPPFESDSSFSFYREPGKFSGEEGKGETVFNKRLAGFSLFCFSFY